MSSRLSAERVAQIGSLTSAQYWQVGSALASRADRLMDEAITYKADGHTGAYEALERAAMESAELCDLFNACSRETTA